MASAGLPQMMARQLVQKLAGGGAPPGGPPQASPLGPGAPQQINANPQAGDQVSKQLAELQGADPGAMLSALKQIKSIIVPLYVRSVFQVPAAAREIAQAQKYIDNAIEKMEKAAATAATVSQNPIANNAAIPNPQGGLQDFASGGGA